MTKIILAGVALVLSASVSLAQEVTPQAGNRWYQDGQATLTEKLARQPNTGTAKNIILMISDGNGIASNYATRLFLGQKNGGYGDEAVLPQEKFPYLALVKTYNVNAQTPGSAGSGTALHSGVKTSLGVVGVGEGLKRGDCSQVEANKVKSIVSILDDMGKSVGVISTARLTDATPATAYAQSANRTFEDDSKLPDKCGVKDIADQLLDAIKSGRVDVALGGGRRHFLPKEATDFEGEAGRRRDGRNLMDEAREAGAEIVTDDVEFAALNPDDTAPVLGLFESDHMKYEYDRIGEPSLAEMVEASIKRLQGNENGFFLSVEAGRIDHANHDGNLYRALTDGVAFADAVSRAVALTSSQDTLIIVTGDHSSALTFNGYCGRGSPITGLCYKINKTGVKHLEKPARAKDGKPYTVAGYLNGKSSVLKKDENYSGSRPVVTEQQASDPDYLQQALVPLSAETHSGADVAVYARGPWAHLLDGTIEQNFIFHVMKYAAEAQ
tara:strand:+ start:4069 stop:5559 length:1491 start_codon:yes stop_codon:yes gene_type:complete